MAEYIDKQDAIDIFKQFKKRKWISMPIEQVIEIISVVPYVEVEPIKHGRWIDEGLVDGNQNRYCRCSECGKGDTQAISQRVPYCWWCGAKMDGEENG